MSVAKKIAEAVAKDPALMLATVSPIMEDRMRAAIEIETIVHQEVKEYGATIRKLKEEAEQECDELKAENERLRLFRNQREDALRTEVIPKGSPFVASDVEYMQVLASHEKRVVHAKWFCEQAEKISVTLSRLQHIEQQVALLRVAAEELTAHARAVTVITSDDWRNGLRLACDELDAVVRQTRLSGPPASPATPAHRVYIAGPMSGIADHNYPAFNMVARKLREHGIEVINPAELHPQVGKPHKECMRVDLPALLTCSHLVMLPEWQASRGANLENSVADGTGIPTHYLQGTNDADLAAAVEWIRSPLATAAVGES